jgi:transposase InsO family protein
MPWKELNVMDQRKEFVLESLKSATPFTHLCSKYGISSKTGYKWKERFLAQGFQGLEDQSKKPYKSPSKLSEDVILEIIKIKNKKMYWGAKKIHQIYQNNNPRKNIPSVATISRLLKKAGLTTHRRRIRNKSGYRITNKVIASRPNHIWTVDFKGWWYTPYDEKCNPLTVRDDFSKYILCIKAIKKAEIYEIKGEFEKLFKKYGLPEIIRTDNGPPFASKNNLLGVTKLAVWWMALGIKLDRIKPGSPYQNGGHERMHLDMKKELEGKITGNIINHQKVFDKWRKEFNDIRPHESLKMKTPSMVYEKSKIKYYKEKIIFDYPPEYKHRYVNDRGFIYYKDKQYFIGNPFTGYNVGVLLDKRGNMKIYFGDIQLGDMDLFSCLLIPNILYKIDKKNNK